MSQFDFATIDPNAKSGTQLAVDLNNWRDALHSGHRGASRPAYAQGGMLWVRETSAEQWDLMFYDGDTDFVLRSVNPTTNQLVAIPQSAVSGLSEIATATAELEGGLQALEGRYNSEIDFTIIYPNGGSEASPASVSVNSRYISGNPFPGHRVFCVAQVLIGGVWGEAPFIFSDAGGASGVRASQLNDGQVIVQTGSTRIKVSSAASGDPFGDYSSVVTVPVPCRVLVWKLKGAI